MSDWEMIAAFVLGALAMNLICMWAMKDDSDE